MRLIYWSEILFYCSLFSLSQRPRRLFSSIFKTGFPHFLVMSCYKIFNWQDFAIFFSKIFTSHNEVWFEGIVHLNDFHWFKWLASRPFMLLYIKLNDIQNDNKFLNENKWTQTCNLLKTRTNLMELHWSPK